MQRNKNDWHYQQILLSLNRTICPNYIRHHDNQHFVMLVISYLERVIYSFSFLYDKRVDEISYIIFIKCFFVFIRNFMQPIL